MYRYIKNLFSSRIAASLPQVPTTTSNDIEEASSPVSRDCPEVPSSVSLLPFSSRGLPTLAIDLDETLVHSSFSGFSRDPDLSLELDVGGFPQTVSVLIRPYAVDFIERLSEFYEIVIFTASIAHYAKQVVAALDRSGVISACLSRHHCVYHSFVSGCGGTYVKDLTCLGRPLERTLLVDNNPASYMFQPQNGVPCSSWYGSRGDTELAELCEHLIRISHLKDLRSAASSWPTGSLQSVSTPEITTDSDLSVLSQTQCLSQIAQSS